MFNSQSELISASSDSTVRIWEFDGDGSVFNVGNMSHGSFIYTAVYHPLFSNDRKYFPLIKLINRVVVTGGHDGLIRSWEYNIKDKIAPKCTNTIFGHKNYINSLLFDEDGQKMYSADSAGYIRVWDVSLNEDQLPNFKCIASVDIFYVRTYCK